MCTFAFENLAIMVQKRPLHPILAQADEIAERGLVVFDDIRSMPLYDEPYTTDLMTIQEITNHLGFPDQASFSRFFKTNTGQSPTEYRGCSCDL